ncbi:hypothetical protein [Nocardia sp. BMG51109]|uniref:hypothetical protein n=1 Tax=Nocardia sp. BMG51109 TaxID=1056816 RepID=UPI00046675A7|nr:hypothetical protein [Nocardia sp. BMG51109]
MRSIKAGIVAAVLTATTVAAAHPASADEPAPAPEAPDEIISLDINLLGCSLGAGLGADLLLAFAAGGGSSTMINTGLATRLRAAGCLPWKN